MKYTSRLAAWLIASVCLITFSSVVLAQQVSTEQSNQAAELYNRGRVLYGRGKVDDAIALYRQALAITPAFPEALTNLGLALDSQGKYDDGAVASADVSSKIPAQ